MASNVHITPVGKLVFPNLNVARQFQGKGPFAYDTLFDIEGPEGKEFADLILNYGQDVARRNKLKKPLDLTKVILDAVDKEGNALPDTYRFKFKATIQQTKKGLWDRKPAFYAEDGKPMSPEPELWSGTVATIAFTFYEWFFAGNHGITLQPEALRIHELVTGGVAGNRSHGALFGGAAQQSTPPAVPGTMPGGNF